MNLRTRSLDTSKEADALQVNILRKMSPEERLQRSFELLRLEKEMQSAGVRMRHPEYNEDEVRLAVIRLRLGDNLFLKVYPHATHIRP